MGAGVGPDAASRPGVPATDWGERDVPDQSGRTIVVTGASSGLGLENTRALAAAGARVVMATRNPQKTREAAYRVHHAVPSARLEHVRLDLADLGSVAEAAGEIRRRYTQIAGLLCNAGLMATPLRRTRDGFELQLGVNHLGHAALVARLLPALVAASPRVVVVSSQLHRIGRIDLQDPNFAHRPYQRWLAYGQSKLANLLYVRALSRRLALARSPVTVAAAHPGYARTELQVKGPAMQGGLSGRTSRLLGRIATTALGQHPSAGALPSLFAMTVPQIAPGSYWGPTGLGGLRGRVGRASASRAAEDDTTAARLFDLTERLTSVHHGLPTRSA